MRAGAKGRIGALSILAGCFAASALLRTGDVIAALPEALNDGFGHQVATSTGTAGDREQAGISAASELISALKQQRAQVEERSRKLDAREALLAAVEQRVERRLKEVTEARDRLVETAALVDDAAVKDVRRLAEMYQRMKPKQAGQIFDQMDPAFASGFLAEMRADSAALILASMEATKAYAVTLLLAGRNIGPAGQPPPDLQ